MNCNYQISPLVGFHQQEQLLGGISIQQKTNGSDSKKGVPGIRDLSEEREIAKQQKSETYHSPRNMYSQSALRQQRVIQNPGGDKFCNSAIDNSYEKSFKMKQQKLDTAVETLECQWMSIKQQHGNFDTRSSSNSPVPMQKINGLKNRDLSLSNLICYEQTQSQNHAQPSQHLQQQQPMQQQMSEKKTIPLLNIVKPINIINKVVPHSKINLILGNDSSRNLNNSVGSIVNVSNSCSNLQIHQQQQQQPNNIIQQQSQHQPQSSYRDLRNSIEDQRAHLKNIYDKYQNVHKKKNPEQNQMLKILKIMENKQDRPIINELNLNSLSMDKHDPMLNSYRKLSQQSLSTSLQNNHLSFSLSQIEKSDLSNIVQQQQKQINYEQYQQVSQQLQQQQQQQLVQMQQQQQIGQDKKNYHKRQGSYNQDNKTPKKLTICNIIPKREEYNRNNLKAINQINYQDIGQSTELSSRRLKIEDSNINLSQSITNQGKEQTPIKLATSSSQSQNLLKQTSDKQISNSRIELDPSKQQQQLFLNQQAQPPSTQQQQQQIDYQLTHQITENNINSNSRLISGGNINQSNQKNQDQNSSDLNIKKVYVNNYNNNLNQDVYTSSSNTATQQQQSINKILTTSKKSNVITSIVQTQQSPQNNQLIKKINSNANNVATNSSTALTINNNNFNNSKISNLKENQQINNTKKLEAPKQKFVGLFSQEFAKRGSVANKNEILKNPPIPLFK